MTPNNIFISKFKNINDFIIYALIIFLITGPALPDILISFISIYTIGLILKNKTVSENLILLFSSFFLLLFPNLFSLDISYSFPEQLVNIRYFVFAFFIATFAKINFDVLIKIFSITLSILTFDLVFQYFLGYNIFGFPISIEHPNRASSFFRDELIAGTFIYKFSLPVIGYYLYNKKNLQAFFLSLIFLIGLICSGERMSFLLFFLGVFILLLFDYKQIIRNLIILILLLVISLVSYIFSDGVKERFENFNEQITTVKNKNYADQGHLSHYITAINIFKDHKYFGTGHSSFRKICKNYEILDSKNKRIGCSTHPHNIYLEIISEGGLFGFITMITFFIILIFKFIKNNIHKSQYSGLLALFITIIWPVSSSGNFFNNRVGITNFLFIGLLLYFCKKDLFIKNEINK